MERPVFQPVGTAAIELDTPALVVDLDTATTNIERFHRYFQDTPAKLRPHLGFHQCPRIGHLQMAAGNTSGGIAVTSVGEAEVFGGTGFNDILVTGKVVTRSAMQRLCALAQTTIITISVDNTDNIFHLSQIAMSSGIRLRVLIEVDSGSGWSGVQPGQAGLDLARIVENAAGLEFSGLFVNDRIGMDGDWEQAANKTHESLEPIIETRKLIENSGMPVATVIVNGDSNFDTASRISGITEIYAGIYPLMDWKSSQIRPEFSPAAKILATVISHPIEARAVVDAGHKATAPDEGLPVLEGNPGAEATRFSAEHGILDLEQHMENELQPGAKVWLVPYNLELSVNQYDYFRAVRGSKLVGFWPISARGRFE